MAQLRMIIQGIGIRNYKYHQSNATCDLFEIMSEILKSGLIFHGTKKDGFSHNIKFVS